MKSHFYHHTFWKHFSAFADIFNDMSVFVYNKERTAAIGKKNVPVIIAPKEKVISNLLVNGLDKPQSNNQLPKISVFWNSIEPDLENRARGLKSDRRLLIETTVDEDGKTKKREVYSDLQTVPYKMGIELVIWTKYQDEAVQLLENILPFFNPELPISIYERAVGIERKCSVKLISVAPNFVGDLNEPDRRIVQYNLSFVMECNLYRPLAISGDIQKVSITVASATNPHTFSGDVIYTTTLGISGEILDDGIRQCIIGFDSLEEKTDNPNTYEDETRYPLDTELALRTIRLDELDYLNNVLIPTLTEGTSAYNVAISRRDLVNLQIDTDVNTTTSLSLSGQGHLEPLYNVGDNLAHDYYNIINSNNPTNDG